MSRFASEQPLKSILFAMSVAALTCVGCGDESDAPAEVGTQDEIQQWLAENPEADVDMDLDDEDAVDE